MTTITATRSGGIITAFIDFVPFTIDDSHPNFRAVDDYLKSTPRADWDATRLQELIHIPTAIVARSDGLLKLHDDSVYFGNHELQGYDVTKLLEMIQNGEDHSPLARFLERRVANPSFRAQQELYLFLEHANMPLLEDGRFIAYKKVRDDYGSFHDGGRTKNLIGTVVSMPGRHMVDDDRNRTCSHGLHFCSWHYLPHYYGNQGKVLVLAIDPADVVSIPSDYQNAKGRAWKYEVIGEIPENQAAFAFAGVTTVNRNMLNDWRDAVASGETTLGYADWFDWDDEGESRFAEEEE